jgi:deazaflavin-dependent oxidoreductase (nitroreductase family)
MSVTRYKRPDWFTAHVMNPAVSGLARMGVSLIGSRILEVPGRKSGEPRRTPVNLLVVDGERYLVAPRGQTEWVRNLRASGQGRLILGRKSEPFGATELADEEKVPVIREYFRRFRFEVGAFFDIRADAPDDEILRIAPDHPAFRLGPPPA